VQSEIEEIERQLEMKKKEKEGLVQEKVGIE
jgi:hypothetical protein